MSIRRLKEWVLLLIFGIGLHTQWARATDLTGDNLTLTGTADIAGGTISLGTGASSYPGWQAAYTDGTTSHVDLQATRDANIWRWWQKASSTAELQMTLDGDHKLILYDQSSTPVAMITLDPMGASTITNSLTVNGTDNQMPNQTLTGTTSVLTVGLADSRYFPIGGTMALSVFPGASATGIDSVALGDTTSATGTNSVALGNSTTASGDYSFAQGLGSTASGTASIAAGGSTADAQYSTALGGSHAGDSTGFGHSTALGGSSVDGSYAVAIGCANASGWGASAMGFGSSANYGESVAIGQFATANTYNATALGTYVECAGYGALATGFTTTADANYSFATGMFTSAASYNSSVMGAFNVGGGDPSTWVDTDPLFEIGNGGDGGSNGNPAINGTSDAFVIYKNGNATLQGTFTASGLTSTGTISTAGAVTAPSFIITVTGTTSTDVPMFGH